MKIWKASLLTAGIVLLAAPLSPAEEKPQERMQPTEMKKENEYSRREPAVRGVDNPEILTMNAVTKQVTGRQFVEAFFRALALEDPQTVYERFFHPNFKEHYTREQFTRLNKQFNGAAGELKTMTILYLREENRQYDGRDGGWADYVLGYEKDPRVTVRIEFRRDQEGWLRVSAYSMNSSQMERLTRAREASRKSTEKKAPPAAPKTP